jgi:hypothetical protein
MPEESVKDAKLVNERVATPSRSTHPARNGGEIWLGVCASIMSIPLAKNLVSLPIIVAE